MPSHVFIVPLDSPNETRLLHFIELEDNQGIYLDHCSNLAHIARLHFLQELFDLATLVRLTRKDWSI